MNISLITNGKKNVQSYLKYIEIHSQKAILQMQTILFCITSLQLI